MACGRCWVGFDRPEREIGPFRLVRDPGHWGSADPAVLVLGISKGNTQSKAVVTGAFDAVAFKGIRDRLLEVLQTVGLLTGENLAQFERRFLASEREVGFASVVRCSLTGMDRKKGTHTADSPNVIPAFRPGSEGYAFVSACVDKHLGHLPPATRTVVLLGNSNSYIRRLRDLIGIARGPAAQINKVAYRAGGVLFVHVTHPSKGNGYFGAFTRGEGTSGEKMRLAREALRQVRF
jgi:hypothetical protein